MVDCLISQSSCSATFMLCRSFENRIYNNNENSSNINSNNSNGNNNENNNNSDFLQTTISSGKTGSVVDNHHRDCNSQNRTKNKKFTKHNKQKQQEIKNRKDEKTTPRGSRPSIISPTQSLVFNVGCNDCGDDNQNCDEAKNAIPSPSPPPPPSTLVTQEEPPELEKKEVITSISDLPQKYRILSFKLGQMKVIDTNIMLYLSYKDGLNFSKTNKYFHKWINDTLYDYFIFDCIKNSLFVIPQRAQNIKNEIENNKHDKENGSHLFISRCIKNGMFKQFLYILEKNTFCECNDKSTMDEFMNRFDNLCKTFFICRDLAKQYCNGQMFPRKIDYLNGFQLREYEEVSARWQDGKQSSENTTTTTAKSCGENIKCFIKYIHDIINNIQKCDEKLFTNENDHWRATKKIDQYYNDLFDALNYFAGFSGENNERAKYKADSTFRLFNSKWRYFEETICVWLLVIFMDKLPATRKFIGSYDKRYCGDKYHIDFGGNSYLEFFLQLKIHMVNHGDIFRWRNFYDEMYREDNNGELDFIFDYAMPVTTFRQLYCVHYHTYVGSFRMNFILSSFFLTNSKRLNNRSRFIKSLFMHKTDKLYNKIGNLNAKKDCTLNRLTYLFLKDVRPFGTIKRKQTNGVNICREFNFAPWIEFYSAVRGDKRSNCPFELPQFAEKLLDSRKRVKSKNRANVAVEMTDQEFERELYRYCVQSFPTMCCKSNNLDYESMNNKVFVSKTNSLIKQIQRQKA